ncbi:amino acid adenylation domain-containing protein [Streptomyces anulatus]
MNVRSERRESATDVPYDVAHGFLEQFEEAVLRTPAAPAVIAAGAGAGAEPVGYARLDRTANAIAHRLHDAGIGPGRTVAVLLPRTPVLLAALIGVMKAGAAYVPLDPALPAERLAFLLKDSGSAAVLTDGRVDHALVVRPDGSEAPEPPAVRPGPGHPAYVIYTSGSTGTPKGVVVPHRALTNLLTALGRDFPLGSGDGWLSVTTPSFDMAVPEYFLPLTRGATIHLADAETTRSGHRLRACVESPGITHLQATPVSWQLLLDAGWAGTPGLTALCGGERMPASLSRALPARGARLWNMYGPTETTVWSVSTRVEEAFDDVPLGSPLSHTQLHVLDAGLRPAPVGTTGELYIGGDGVTQGYLHRPAQTAERFVPDPFTARAGARMYRTGDLVRRRTDGRIAFVGRADTQVKVHGHRIEPGEVETALERDPRVRRAAVAVDGEGAQARLVAFVETARDAVVPGELREALRSWLPAYAVPSLITIVATLPLTPNGKVDRRALPGPGRGTPGTAQDAPGPPRTDAERRVADIVAALVPGVRVGRDDDLFDRGAHSLVMARLVERVRDEFGTVPPLSLLFGRPTIAAIAAYVEETVRSPARNASAGPEDPGDKVPENCGPVKRPGAGRGA